jgi:hypothetical protein
LADWTTKGRVLELHILGQVIFRQWVFSLYFEEDGVEEWG